MNDRWYTIISKSCKYKRHSHICAVVHMPLLGGAGEERTSMTKSHGF